MCNMSLKKWLLVYIFIPIDISFCISFFLRERERDVWSQAHAGLSNMMLCVINHKIQKVGIAGND